MFNIIRFAITIHHKDRIQCYSIINNKKVNTVIVLELQQANPEDVQLHINSKELIVIRYLITTGLYMPRTSLYLVVDTKRCLADLWG